MDDKQKQQIIQTIENALVFLWGITFLLFPVFFLTITTDFFILPKQILLMLAVFLSLVLWSAKMILEEKVRIRRTPFDIPVAIVMVVFLLSSLFSQNRLDSFISFIPVFIAGLDYFVLVNVVRKKEEGIFLATTLLVGAAAAGLIHLLSYYKIYLRPFPSTHVVTFTTFGSIFDQLLFLAAILPLGLVMAYPLSKGKTNATTITFAALSALVVTGIAITAIELLTNQKPLILPFEVGFQTAFAAISQDTRRVAQGFFFGSGYGTYFTDFTRFKQATFNTNPTLWFVNFNKSSSFVLELLATTGALGILSLLFLAGKVFQKPAKKVTNPLFAAVALILLLSLVLPFSYLHVALLFLLLALFAVFQAHSTPSQFYDIELRFVTLKKGIISFANFDDRLTGEEKQYTKIMPIIMLSTFAILILLLGFFTVRFVYSDMLFQKSLVASAANNGTATYQDRNTGITVFPYRRTYYSIVSQTNLALSNCLAAVQAKNGSPSAQIQQTLYTLIQQSITAARQATTLAPITVTYWQNLSSVYRSLIGFGQNAESFAILANQQAIILDPTNPQEYISLGGLYYQLGQYAKPIQQFTQAATLKQDFANAYYNLGHAYEQKGDLQNALTNYQIIKQLVPNDSANEKRISNKIPELQAKIGNQNQNQAAQKAPTSSTY